MKIITWNCNMAFRKKAGFILSYNPDILIVPECEHPDKLKFSGKASEPTDKLWFGTNPNKGLGIFSYSDFRFRLLDNYDPLLKTIIPIAVTGGQHDFTLFAIWAYNTGDPDGHYTEQVWKAIHHYADDLTRGPTVLMGDFNSNTIWDWKSRIANHSDVVKYLEERGIVSSYHRYHNQTQGEERHPTLYMHRRKDKPYHIDYCFTSMDMSKKIQSVEIGDYDFWMKHSDHVPVIVTFN